MKKHTSNRPNISGINRRSFIKGTLATGAFLAAAPNILLGAPGDKVRLACIGIGGQGGNDIRQFNNTDLATVVALCDTDIGAGKLVPRGATVTVMTARRSAS